MAIAIALTLAFMFTTMWVMGPGSETVFFGLLGIPIVLAMPWMQKHQLLTQGLIALLLTGLILVFIAKS